jgi:acyl-CoA-binding protein
VHGGGVEKPGFFEFDGLTKWNSLNEVE